MKTLTVYSACILLLHSFCIYQMVFAQPYNEEHIFSTHIGHKFSRFGFSVAADGNRYVAGAPGLYNIGVGTSGAVYVYDWDGTSWVETKLTASDGAPGHRFGQAVSIHGDRIVVGTPSDDDNGVRSGSVYVYDWDGTSWVETKLTASDGAIEDIFGRSVSVHGDRIVVGTPLDDDDGDKSGSAYVYDWDGTSWVETKLTASDGAPGDRFGKAVSIHGDRIVVGTPYDDHNGVSSGSVYVYDWDGSDWIETKLTASDHGAGDEFGQSVSNYGDHIVVGAPSDDANGAGSGSVYVYDWDGSEWVETKLTASDGGFADTFGYSVSMYGDRIVVGAYSPLPVSSHPGAGYVYGWDGSSWVEEEKLTASDGTIDDFFGHSVSIHGNNIIVGNPTDNDNDIGAGSVYVYNWDGSDWIETKVVASDGASLDYFGQSVSIDGHRILIGAPFDDDQSGAAYIYGRDGSSWIETELIASDGSAEDEFGGSVSIHGDRIVVGAQRDDDNGANSGSVYLYDWDGSAWIETKITASDGAINDAFGCALSIHGDRIVVGAQWDNDDGANSGSVYVYEWNGSAWVETKITASDGDASNEFGGSVSIHGDRIVVGARRGDGNDNGSGSAYVYDWDGVSWIESKITASDGAVFDYFGHSMSVYGDRIVVGAKGDNFNRGSVYVYDWDGNSWVETKLTASDGPFSDEFGHSVSVHGDRIVVGAHQDGDNGVNSGAAYVYDWDGSTWIEKKIVASEGAVGDRFGYAVAASDSSVLVGNRSQAGRAYLFSAFCEHPDYTGLMALYDATAGDDWFINTGWKGCDPCRDNAGGPWYGVTCDTIDGIERVTDIVLNGNILNGSIPVEIGELTHLKRLVLSSNPQLTGSIPSSIGNLRSLEELHLGLCNLSGSLPDSLGNLDSLVTLKLFVNQFSGAIPATVGNMSSLESMQLFNNMFSDSLPSELGDLVSIREILLSSNNLSGNIPPELGNLDSLITLSLSNNNLSGSIPAELGNIPSLTSVDMNNNQLAGCFDMNLHGWCAITANIDCGGTCNNFDAMWSDFCANPAVNNCDVCIHPDFAPLVALYDSLNGPNWAVDSSWKSSCDPCEWFGVGCDSIGGQNRVVALDLQNNNLSGSFPAIQGLTELDTLLLSFNNISGPLPTDWTGFPNLKIFHANNNSLSGELPSGISAMTDLEELKLSANALHGSLPISLSTLPQLRELILGTNSFSDTIPAAYGNMSNLKVLYLNSNNLSGSIPAALGNLSNLELLRLDVNDLTDSIPSALGNLGNLIELSLHTNDLSGTIPASLGNLTNILQFLLFNNQLTGNIPSTLGNLTNVFHFNLSTNQLTGSIPATFSTLSGATILHLYANNLSGCFHPSLSSLCSVNILDFSGNVNLPGGGDFASFCDTNAGACEICPSVLNVVDNPLMDGTYHAGDTLISSGVVLPMGDVIFKAGNMIHLDGGFEVKTGGVFEAKNEGCN